MNLSPGFRRMLAWTLVSGVISLIWTYWPSSSPCDGRGGIHRFGGDGGEAAGEAAGGGGDGAAEAGDSQTGFGRAGAA